MAYRLNVQRIENNPHYASEAKEYNKVRVYERPFDVEMPQKTKVTDVLLCELTDEEFTALKYEVLKKIS